jgi:hypothetical protein
VLDHGVGWLRTMAGVAAVEGVGWVQGWGWQPFGHQGRWWELQRVWGGGGQCEQGPVTLTAHWQVQQA